MEQSNVEIELVSQGYGRRMVLRDFSLRLGAGTYGLLGPNGAGKTTLMNTIATVAPPRRGTVYICGVSVTSPRSADEARRQIGYLPQHFGYFGAFTIGEFVQYCGWLRGLPSSQLIIRSLEAIDRVNLTPERKMKALSGGMLRRAGIAAAIVGNPRLILLDEPTVGLDPAQRLDFRQMVRTLGTDRTVLLCTHLVDDIEATCDSVLVMADGKIRYSGTPAALAELGRSASVAGDTQLERGYMLAMAGSIA